MCSRHGPVHFSLRQDTDDALPKIARQSGMTFLSRALGSPEYWKHPVLKKLFTIFRNRHERAHEILHAALDDGQGGEWGGGSTVLSCSPPHIRPSFFRAHFALAAS